MKWFDNIYVINLDSRPDRLEKVTEEFNKLSLSFERVSAVDGNTFNLKWVENNNIPGWTKGAAGLVETTIKILEDAKAKGYKSILICEDDILFSDRIKEFTDTFKLPDSASWDMFFFGFIHERRPRVITNNIISLRRSYCCHCYAINERVYDEYLEQLKLRNMPIDWVTAGVFQPSGRCLATSKSVVYQKPDYSNIRNQQVHNKVN